MTEIMRGLENPEMSRGISKQEKAIYRQRAKELVLQGYSGRNSGEYPFRDVCRVVDSGNLPDYPFRAPCRVMDCRSPEFKHLKTGYQGTQALEHAVSAVMSPLKGRRIAIPGRNVAIADSLR